MLNPLIEKLDLTHVYRHRETVFAREEKSIIQVYSLTNSSDSLYKIDGIAAKIWKKIDGKRTLNEVMSSVREENKIPAHLIETFESDSEGFIAKLVELQFIQRI